jgi:hypothetical protein
MGTKGCKFCDKEGLLILPLRYAAVVGDSKALADVPALPDTLGEGVDSLKLSHGKYAPRMMREDCFIYTLTERTVAGKTLSEWDGYKVVGDAFLYKFDAKSPPTTQDDFNCDASVCGIDASCIAINKVDQVTKVYLLFTPSPMTEAKLDEYKTNARSYADKGKMQVFDPKAWAKGTSRGQPHSLKPELIGQHVPEWILFKKAAAVHDSSLGKVMGQQLFPALNAAYAGLPPIDANGTQVGRLGILVHKLKEKEAAAFVLHDHIGIAQELNDYRNAALEPINAFLISKDKLQVPHQRKLEISQAIADVKDGVLKNLMTADKASLDSYREFNDIQDQRRLDEIQILRQTGREELAKTREAEMARAQKLRRASYDKAIENSKNNAPEIWAKKYEPRLDRGEITTFENDLKGLSDYGLEHAKQRSTDHLKWIESERLVNAFDTYDPLSVHSGFEYTLQHSVSTIGMVGEKQSAKLVEKWTKVDKVERHNLYMRAYLFNQTYLQDEANTALKELKTALAPIEDVSNVSTGAWIGLSKKFFDTFKKLDSAWDEWLRDGTVKDIHKFGLDNAKGVTAANKTTFRTISTFHRSAEGVVYKFFSEWTQITARSTTTGKLDKAIIGTAALMLNARIGNLAGDMARADLMKKVPTIQDLMLYIPPEKLAEGYKKRSAARNLALAERRATGDVARSTNTAQGQANVQAAKLAEQTEDSIGILVKDAQKKAQEKVRLSMAELETFDINTKEAIRPPTNNYHQARIGAALMAIEALALTNKVMHFEDTVKAKAEITASVMSLVSMGADMMYAVAKSVREIEPYKVKTGYVNRAADVVRGGYKFAAGSLATAAGAITAVLDGYAAFKEAEKDNGNYVLLSIYITRSGVSGYSAYLGFMAAFSYSGPLLTRLAEHSGGRFAVMLASRAAVAGNLALVRTMWLIRLARWNMAGLVLTVGEVIYRCFFMDNALQDWCDACTFRKDKSTGLFKATPFADSKKELDALYKAAEEVKS